MMGLGVSQVIEGLSMGIVRRIVTFLVVIAAAVVMGLGAVLPTQGEIGREEVFAAIMTVGSMANSKGYFGAHVGSITERVVTVDGEDFALVALRERPAPSKTLELIVTEKLSDLQVEATTLWVAGQSYAWEDATHSVQVPGTHTYTWRAEEILAWSTDDEISVLVTALPILRMSAEEYFVRVGDVVEVQVVRSGIAADDLAVKYDGFTERTTGIRIFEEGEFTFVISYEVVDADRDMDGACILYWHLYPAPFPGHYVVDPVFEFALMMIEDDGGSEDGRDCPVG